MEEQTGGRLSRILERLPFIDIWIRPRTAIPRLMGKNELYTAIFFLNAICWLVLYFTPAAGFRILFWQMSGTFDLNELFIGSIFLSTVLFFVFLLASCAWVYIDAYLIQLSSILLRIRGIHHQDLVTASMWNLANKLVLSGVILVSSLLFGWENQVREIFTLGTIQVRSPYSDLTNWVIVFLIGYYVWLYWIMLSEAMRSSKVQAVASWTVSRIFLFALFLLPTVTYMWLYR